MDMQIKFDADDVIKRFEFLKKDKGVLKQKITRAILNPLKTKVRKKVRSIFKKTTGRPARYTDTWAFKDGTGRLFLGSFYGRFKEDDQVIRPKDREFLQFKIGDKWFRKKDGIFIKGKDIVKNVWKTGTSEAAMRDIAEMVMKKEFEKWVNK